MKNSPSAVVKEDSLTATKSPNPLRRVPEWTISATAYSEKWLTTKGNITVPVSVTRKNQV